LTAETAGPRRAAELERYGVLGVEPRRELVAVADVAAQVAGVPMASISLIDDVEQHQVATVGFPGIVCAREDSMCNAVLGEAEPVIVPDARTDPRFQASPFVTGVYGNVRFYAAHQLRTPSGTVIGMLCVLDTEPQTITGEQQRALGHLAERVVDLLELSVRTRELERRTDDLTAVVEQLRQTQAELERSNEQLSAFAGRVSHDLHNPLTAVSMSLSMLDEQVEGAATDDDRMHLVVERASRAADRMHDMIDDLLAFSQVNGHLSACDTDLAQLVEEAREDLEPVLAGVAVHVDPLPVVHGDPAQLRVLLQNLLENAAKFARPEEPQRIDVTSARLGDSWRIVVRDHGIGIPADARRRVFEPFERSTDQAPGSGLGLATVQSIIRAHGGKVGIEETPGGGATVWFDLPAADAVASGRTQLDQTGATSLR
jgi:signal transduction histidine kinase